MVGAQQQSRQATFQEINKKLGNSTPQENLRTIPSSESWHTQEECWKKNKFNSGANRENSQPYPQQVPVAFSFRRVNKKSSERITKLLANHKLQDVGCWHVLLFILVYACVIQLQFHKQWEKEIWTHDSVIKERTKARQHRKGQLAQIKQVSDWTARVGWGETRTSRREPDKSQAIRKSTRVKTKEEMKNAAEKDGG